MLCECVGECSSGNEELVGDIDWHKISSKMNIRAILTCLKK